MTYLSLRPEFNPLTHCLPACLLMAPSSGSFSTFSQALTPALVYRNGQFYIGHGAKAAGTDITISASWQYKTIKYNFYPSRGTLIKLKISDKARMTETLPVADPPKRMYLMNTLKGNEKTMQKFMQAY